MIYITVLTLAFVQNIAFTLVSRARNRDSTTYHALTSVLSNGMWFATMHYLVVSELDWKVAPFYILGTVVGSVFGQKISIFIETRIGAKT